MQAPTHIGRYQIKKMLGSGAMGIVYLAFDPDTQRQVAIKTLLLKGDVANDQKMAELRELITRQSVEARAVGMLHSDNIVDIYDANNDEGQYYLVMEYIEGQTLYALMQSQRVLSPHSAIDIISQVLDGLTVAHGEKVVHRDIKPANIMVANTGRIKLMDFGVAKIVSDPQHTVFGVRIGTPHYWSPEQRRAERVDGRADLFAVGVILYEMITGIKPFAEKLEPLDNAPAPKPPTQVNPKLPADFDAILKKALAISANERFQTAAEFKQSLQRIDFSNAGRTKKINHLFSQAIYFTPAQVKDFTLMALVGMLLVLVSAVSFYFVQRYGEQKISNSATLAVKNKRYPENAFANTLFEPTSAGNPASSVSQGAPTIIRRLVLAPPPFMASVISDSENNQRKIPKLVKTNASPRSHQNNELWLSNNGLLPIFLAATPAETKASKLKNIPESRNNYALMSAFRDTDVGYAIYASTTNYQILLTLWTANFMTLTGELDFSAYVLSPENLRENKKVAIQQLRFAHINDHDKLLYVAHSHDTSAKYSNGKNAYLTAIDLKTGQLVWRSQPLVANAANFVEFDDALITGYGYTAEPDYLYVINRHSGHIEQRFPLKTAPELLALKGNKLLVRTYDIDYAFDLK